MSRTRKKMPVGLQLDRDQVQWAEHLAKRLTELTGIEVHRADVLRKAIALGLRAVSVEVRRKRRGAA